MKDTKDSPNKNLGPIGTSGMILVISILFTAYTVWSIFKDDSTSVTIYLPLCISHLITWWYLFDLERKNMKS